MLDVELFNLLYRLSVNFQRPRYVLIYKNFYITTIDRLEFVCTLITQTKIC